MKFWQPIQSQLIFFARVSLAIVYIWFGGLKIFVPLSAATPLVTALFNATLARLMPFEIFFPLLGLAEVIIGLMFLWPRVDKLTKVVFGLHMLTTSAPLVLLPMHTWLGFLAPTLEGQYIIKNICLIALALMIWVKPDHQKA